LVTLSVLDIQQTCQGFKILPNALTTSDALPTIIEVVKIVLFSCPVKRT